MKPRLKTVLFSHKYFLLLLFFVCSYALSAKNNYGNDKESEERLKEKLKRQQISFIENKGQFADNEGNPVPELLFKTSLKNLDIYITTSGINYYFTKTEEKEEKERKDESSIIEWSRMNMFLSGATIKKENIIRENPLNEYFNYYLAHCPQGITEVRTYQKITIKEIYPGIDWVLYCSNEQGLKYDFVIHPGANPENICMKYDGAGKIEKQGDYLYIKTGLGEIKEGVILAYMNNSKKNVLSRYDVKGNEVRFKISNYDSKETLIIDPPLELIWSTFYGGSESDGPKDITVDNIGNIYLSGYSGTTGFPTFPLTGAYNQGTIGGTLNAFILKFDNTGIRLWATYFGGNSWDYGYGIDVDISGSIYITGMSDSQTFPVQNLSGAYFQGTNRGLHDIFIAKFNSAGVRLWATLYGGTDDEANASPFGIGGITTDAMKNLYVTGYTKSTNFPTKDPGGGSYYQNTNGGGWDAFILKFDSSGAQQWATYYGGAGDDGGGAVAVDNVGNLYVSGVTASTNFPTKNPIQASNGGLKDVFILKFNSAGVPLWGTYYGGADNDECYWNSITADIFGNVYISGQTKSTNFPLQSLTGAFNQSTNRGGYDVFILKLDTSGNRQWATYYGGSSDDGLSNYTGRPGLSSIISDDYGNIYLAGSTESINIYTYTPGGNAYYQPTLAGSQDLYILQFDKAGSCQWATYYGGNGGYTRDFATGITVNKYGCVFITGELVSVTGLALIDPGGGAYYQNTSGGGDDGYVLQFCYDCIPPTVSVSADNDTICLGDSTILTASGGNLTYSWSPSTNFISVNDSTIKAFPSVTTNYIVTGTDSMGCADTANITITVIPPPDMIITPDTAICLGEHVLLSVSGADSYIWSPATGLASTTDPVVTASPTETTTYTVIGRGFYDCLDTVQVIVTISPLPTADFYFNPPSPIKFPGPICVVNTSTGANQWLWNIENSLYTDTAEDFCYTPLKFGRYCVKLTVKSIDGCLDSITHCIDVFNPYKIEIPNVFTPNDDGTNDKFIIENEGLSELTCVIYNRWGQKMYEWNGTEGGWDGITENGEEASDGVYYYIARAITQYTQEKIVQHGFLHLIR